jgi:hypothetical protein
METFTLVVWLTVGMRQKEVLRSTGLSERACFEQMREAFKGRKRAECLIEPVTHIPREEWAVC